MSKKFIDGFLALAMRSKLQVTVHAATVPHLTDHCAIPKRTVPKVQVQIQGTIKKDESW